jgi:RNA polymerase sigma-70 factor, ECF subfamily
MAEPEPPPSPDLRSTLDLLRRARSGDREALDEIVSRHLGPLRRWARGRLPGWSRDLSDTEDLVQETMIRTLRQVNDFELRNEGSLRSYLRQAILNRIRDEIDRVSALPIRPGLSEAEAIVDPSPSPLDQAIGRDLVKVYESALQRLKPEDRALIIARVEMQQSYAEIASMHGKNSADSARLSVTRALVRLVKEMDVER